MSTLHRIASILCLVLAVAAAGARADTQDVETFIDSYFAAWNERDWRAFSAHFNDDALISDCSGASCTKYNLRTFMRIQRKVRDGVTEKPLSLKLLGDDRGSVVYVEWALSENGSLKKSGVDLFSLIRQPDGALLIHSLIWYQKQDE